MLTKLRCCYVSEVQVTLTCKLPVCCSVAKEISLGLHVGMPRPRDWTSPHNLYFFIKGQAAPSHHAPTTAGLVPTVLV